MPSVRTSSWERSARGSLDLLDLVRAGNFDARTAALCSMVLERHGSMVVAGQPQLAGKSTTLDAFVDLLPKDVRRVGLRGTGEEFEWLPEVQPKSTFMYAAEISDHMPMYIWDEPARKAISLIGHGFALGATLHADSVEETIGVLVDDLGAKPADVARIDLLHVIRVYRGQDGPVRRTVQLTALKPQAGRAGKIQETPLVTYDERSDAHAHDETAEAALVDAAELARRTALIEKSAATDATARATLAT